MADLFRIKMTLNAADDLQKLVEYVSKDSPQNADRLIRRLLDAIDSLELFPNRHQMTRGADRLGVPVRSMVIRPYLIRYHVDDANRVVTVLSVRHGARRVGP